MSAAELRADLLRFRDEEPGLRRGLGRRTRRLLLGSAAASIAALSLILSFNGFRPKPVAEQSIIVLPFANVTANPEVDYLSDGLSESITNALSRMHGLRVIARTTADSYKGHEINFQRLSGELKVRAAVTVRVSATGDRIRVQADLLDTSAGTQLWGENFEGTMNDALLFHEVVVRQVCDRLGIASLPMNQGELARKATSRPEAYQLYLKGRYAAARNSIPELKRAISLFQDAIAADPGYALAYVGIADSYVGLSSMYLSPSDAMAAAKSAARRALEIEPGSPEAQLTSSLIRGWYEYDWNGAVADFRRLCEKNPANASARLWYAWTLVLTGDKEAGLREGLAAKQLDPLSAFAHTGFAQMLYLTRSYDAAMRELQQQVDLDPRFVGGHHHLGIARLQAGRFKEAIRALNTARELDPHQPQPLAYLAYAHAKAGDRTRARVLKEILAKWSRDRYISKFLFAVVELGLGNTDQAIRHLQAAAQERDDMVSILAVDPMFDPCRTDARFRELLKTVGLAN